MHLYNMDYIWKQMWKTEAGAWFLILIIFEHLLDICQT